METDKAAGETLLEMAARELIYISRRFRHKRFNQSDNYQVTRRALAYLTGYEGIW